ncbi:hypothetical protein PNOK_0879300 [Pyrrhoderma noxium]|uniref:DUF6534 domain-containing protein n=1 Tax=Pyrrhoderma noxium TaxID=2282107 RepID=A0A286U8P1_9AGAM|nr:hypothetical protein PNOK_0879300 [Pyrrhoderma noxium]
MSTAYDNTLGALFIAVTFAMALWGIATLQMYWYYDNYIKDPLWIKLFVFLVWALDTAHQALITHAAYVYLVTNFDNPAILTTVIVTLEVMVLVSALVSLLVQGFLLFRVYRLSNKNMYLVGVLALMSWAQFIAFVYFFYRGVNLGSWLLIPTINWLTKTANSLSTITDVSISATLIFLLHRSRTGYKRSDSMINRLIVFTVNTGAVTSICALCVIICVSLSPDSLIYVAFYVCTSRLYTNTLLATLNARRVSSTGSEIPSSLSIHFDDTTRRDHNSIGIDNRTGSFNESSRGGQRQRNAAAGHVVAIPLAKESSHGTEEIGLDELGMKPRRDDSESLGGDEYTKPRTVGKRKKKKFRSYFMNGFILFCFCLLLSYSYSLLLSLVLGFGVVCVGYKDEGEGWRELGRERVDTIDPDGRPSSAIDSDPKS